MDVKISEDVNAEFPELHLAYLEVTDMRIGCDSDRVSELLRDVSQKIPNSLDIDHVKDKQDFRSYRDFFWRIGVDPTKTRPAAEALVRRILRGSSIPRINDFVDSYNIASIESGVPIGAFEIAALDETAILRFSEQGEEFTGIGMSSPKILADRQLVMSSGEELIAIYPYRDADSSKITPDTRDALIISCGVPGISMEQIMEGATKSRDYVLSVCGGHTSKIVML